MQVLIYSERPPLTTRASGDVRFQAVIELMSMFSQITFCTLPMWQLRAEAGEGDVICSLASINRSCKELRFDLLNTIRTSHFDIVVFEFYDSALKWMDLIRFYQPQARILVDSVDLHFRRLHRKAITDKSVESLRMAERVKREELAVYQDADSVILLTPEDKLAFEMEGVVTHTGMIPNIHYVPPLQSRICSDTPSLIFVGGFRHGPNEDAVLYFGREIWPLIKIRLPAARVFVIGEAPPDSVRLLEDESFQVLGHVADLHPLLANADISVAPLRWGGGIKGKVGEAMAYGLPVVTTSIGAEGFGMAAGSDLIIADSADAFSEGVVRLASDPELYQRVRERAHRIILQRFSPEGVRSQVEAYFDDVMALRPRQLPLWKQWVLSSKRAWRQHISWRLGSRGRLPGA